MFQTDCSHTDHVKDTSSPEQRDQSWTDTPLACTKTEKHKEMRGCMFIYPSFKHKQLMSMRGVKPQRLVSSFKESI